MKKYNKVQQLNLFDLLNQPIIEHETESNNNNRNHNRTENSISGERGNQTDAEPGELASPSAFQNDKGAATPAVSAAITGKSNYPVSQQDLFGVRGQHEQTDNGRRMDGMGGEGGRVVQSDSESGTGRRTIENITYPATTATTISLSNFHNNQPLHHYKSFSKSYNLDNNIVALQTLKKLSEEGRLATIEEQLALAKFVSFGGLKEILLDPNKDEDWKTQSDIQLRPRYKEIHHLLKSLDTDGDNYIRSARRSILNAHFTPYPVINGIWKAIEKSGFKGGKVLEPSAGIGNFIAAMPEKMAENSDIRTVEMDGLNAKILSKLFPSAEVYHSPFEKLPFKEKSFDLIVSNVPFGDTRIFDKQLHNADDKRYVDAASNIHNYFIAKSIFLAKPNSMIAILTSAYTLDSSNNDIRKLIAEDCQFLGAIRLPDNTFRANAGTEVVSDILFLRKKEEGEVLINQPNFSTIISKDFIDENGINGKMSYNEYYHNHPENMIGKIEFGGLYRKDAFNLKANDAINIEEEIIQRLDNIISKSFYKEQKESLESVEQYSYTPHELDNIGNLVALDNGAIGLLNENYLIDQNLDEKAQLIGINPDTIRRNFINSETIALLQQNNLKVSDFQIYQALPIRIPKNDIPKAKQLINIRRSIKELLSLELNNFPEPIINNKRDELRNQYQNFTKKFGAIKNYQKLLSNDRDSYIIQSLEKHNRDTKEIKQADILFTRTIHPNQQITAVQNIEDAITLSFNQHGKININLICELLNKPYEQLMSEQIKEGALIFIDENYEHLHRDEYLSGNVVKKLQIATEQYEIASNETLKKRWAVNMTELEKVQPEKIKAIDIFSPIHARWIPESFIKDFITETTKSNPADVNLYYRKSEDRYLLNINTAGNATANAYATERRSAQWIFSCYINGVDPIVKYEIEEEGGKKRQVLDAEDTQLAKAHVRKIALLWDEWKYNTIEKRGQFEEIYNTTFNNNILRNYDGSKHIFPGLTGFSLRPHQKDAVFRNLVEMGGVNDHIVGAGKTLVQIVTAMELRRLKICNKPCIIGLKSQVPQLYETFKQAYPLANVLFPTEKDFQKENRKRLLNIIATNNWDCIILSHDQFNLIQQSVDIQKEMIEEMKKTLVYEINATSDKREKKILEGRLYQYEQRIDKLLNYKKDEDVLNFAQLGIDFLMVDESQEYKNLEFTTQKTNIRGLGNPVGSKRAFNLLVACRQLQKFHNADKGILFCSGTPISNSMAELYLIFKYLCPQELKDKNIETFDKWAALFANCYSELEYSLGTFKEVYRFREFANLPELLTMYLKIADVKNDFNLQLDKPKIKHELVKINPSNKQLQEIQFLQAFIESRGNKYAGHLGLTAGYDEKKGLNPSYALLAINYAKKLSIDPRLINPSNEPGTKINELTKNVFKIYNETNEFKGTQIIFSDIGTPKSNNNVDNIYDYIEANFTETETKEIFGENYAEQTTKLSLTAAKDRIIKTLNIDEDEYNKILAESINTNARFDVYNEIKKELIKLGIPAEQIEFIHDYKTAKQRIALYDSVNSGNIRVIIGSTKKLGTGTNIQEKCVAVHHVDITWRPSDLEQRNGRAGRQGNLAAKSFLNNTVPAFYYATEQTLDASMYNTVSQKSTFIAQIKTANTKQRTIKDIQEDIDMGTMAAELSGDPIFLEKATLSKQITELTQLHKGFEQKKHDATYYLQKEQKQLSKFQEFKNELTQAIPFLTTIPKDTENKFIFYATYKGQRYQKPGIFGDDLCLYLKKKLKNKIPNEEHVATMFNFNVYARLKPNSFGNNQIEISIKTPDNKNTILNYKDVDVDASMGTSLFIRNNIIEMENRFQSIEKTIEKTSENIMIYQEQSTQVFDRRDELLIKRKRLDEIDAAIIKRNKEVAEQKKAENGNDYVLNKKEIADIENETKKSKFLSR